MSQVATDVQTVGQAIHKQNHCISSLCTAQTDLRGMFETQRPTISKLSDSQLQMTNTLENITGTLFNPHAESPGLGEWGT